jgi:cob(I)alamin adenosyltransferase
MKIYTKTGDDGETGLIGGSRVPKNDMRIEAYGTIDELNAFTGLLISKTENAEIVETLRIIQHKLFVIGSHLATDQELIPLHKSSVIVEKDILEIESAIDKLSCELPELKYFVLPGGSEKGALAHICRTITRRAERRILDIKQLKDEIDNEVLIYINRLSDYFFILSRYLTVNEGHKEFFWKNDD